MDGKYFILKEAAQVTMVTFGGFQHFTLPAGYKFITDIQRVETPEYSVFQSGLNYYIFPTRAVGEMLDYIR